MEASQPSEPATEPEVIPPASKLKKRYPSAEGDDDLIDDLETIFRRLTWDGRARGMRRLQKLYNDWRVGKS
jgi:hypothetical protein